MNREETLKKFNTYSSLFLVLGVLDLVLIWLSFGNKDMIALLHGGGSAAASALRILFLVTVVLGVILAVLKFYVGIQGLRQVKGNARGDLHLKVAQGYDDPVDDLPGVIPAYDTQGRRRCLRRPAGSGCCDFSGTVCKVREDTDDNEVATRFHNQTDLRDSFEDHITPHFSCLFFVALKQTLMTSRL